MSAICWAVSLTAADSPEIAEALLEKGITQILAGLLGNNSTETNVEKDITQLLENLTSPMGGKTKQQQGADREENIQ